MKRGNAIAVFIGTLLLVPIVISIYRAALGHDTPSMAAIITSAIIGALLVMGALGSENKK